jgi:hypothetical protein
MLTPFAKRSIGAVHDGSPSHRVVPHRVSRGLNFGQLVSGFNSGVLVGRSPRGSQGKAREHMLQLVVRSHQPTPSLWQRRDDIDMPRRNLCP